MYTLNSLRIFNYISGSQLGAILSPGDTGEHLETFLTGTFYWGDATGIWWGVAGDKAEKR